MSLVYQKQLIMILGEQTILLDFSLQWILRQDYIRSNSVQLLIVIAVFLLVEIMGHKVGHICLSAGIASGADIILYARNSL